MTRSLLLAAALHLFFAGCTTTKAPEYQIGWTGSRQTKSDAERLYVGASPKIGLPEDFDTPPRVLSSRFPDYPPELIAVGVFGTVVVGFTVEPDGSVSEPAVQGSPPPELAVLALDSIKRWKFAPATKRGVRVRTRLAQQFVFQVE
ncbi:TonB family protein [Pyxidicoccus fallax]|uniref:TonB family protein n=1 Tax=Pyxidicoccus fallax TaxID=394095 RepID=A0A848LEH7_9BACT|nr:TonB family protein [Pyxidicoccus fallax]NMO15243.1 TonB family protein [Pyxidicoccus fallax]NPC76985.1 TonB family protein [Pyxidicoccus fallax]